MQKNGKIEIWLDRTKCSFSNLLDFWIPQNPYVLAENEKYLPQWVLFRPSEWLPSVFLESKTASYFVKTRNPTVFGMVRPGLAVSNGGFCKNAKSRKPVSAFASY